MHANRKTALRLTALAFFGVLIACERPVIEIELITPVQEVDRAIAERIAALVDEDSNLRISLLPPPSGSRSALDALQAGYGDIAFAPNNKRYRDDIATIMPLYPSVLHIMSRKEKGRPDTLCELLSNATVYAGPPGSIPRLLGEQIVADLNMAHGEVVFVDEPGAEADMLLVYARIDRKRVLNDPRLRDVTLFSFGKPLDDFYTKVIAIRDSIGPTSSVAERNEAIASIRALQNHGFKLVVSEKLAADHSFRIFVELTNDSIGVIRDLSLG